MSYYTEVEIKALATSLAKALRPVDTLDVVAERLLKDLNRKRWRLHRKRRPNQIVRVHSESGRERMSPKKGEEARAFLYADEEVDPQWVAEQLNVNPGRISEAFDGWWGGSLGPRGPKRRKRQ